MLKAIVMRRETRQLKSYVWHFAQCFFVSTIERKSSAIEGPLRYMETIAWEYDWKRKIRQEMVVQTGEGNAFDQHFEVCKQLHRTGKFVD